jgi:predicted neutral ceramidase superfamily lipid hydrolase
MFTFGFLKVVNPTIDGWFHVQIQQSHLPHSAILMGKIAEIMTGILFLLPRFRPWQAKWEGRILLIACSSLFLEMLVAVYVHLQPGVPSEVLPLGIKPPVIPLFVLLLDVMVAVPAWKDSQTEGLPISHRPEAAQPDCGRFSNRCLCRRLCLATTDSRWRGEDG